MLLKKQIIWEKICAKFPNYTEAETGFRLRLHVETQQQVFWRRWQQQPILFWRWYKVSNTYWGRYRVQAATACGHATTGVLTQVTATADTLLKMIQSFNRILRQLPGSGCDCMWKCNNRCSDTSNRDSRYSFKDDTKSWIHTEVETGFRNAE